MDIAYLLTGSNQGDRESYLSEALDYIEKRCGKILRTSCIYETEPWGFTEQPAFLNQAIALETSIIPEELMQILLDIETEMGRIRNVQYGPRIIDIDLLFYGERILNTPFLSVPHPAIQDRKFVLVPLAEIAPELNHPILGKNISLLLKGCPDHSDVQKKIS